jgi:hypothetical protein
MVTSRSDRNVNGGADTNDIRSDIFLAGFIASATGMHMAMLRQVFCDGNTLPRPGNAGWEWCLDPLS